MTKWRSIGVPREPPSPTRTESSYGGDDEDGEDRNVHRLSSMKRASSTVSAPSWTAADRRKFLSLLQGGLTEGAAVRRIETGRALRVADGTTPRTTVEGTDEIRTATATTSIRLPVTPLKKDPIGDGGGFVLPALDHDEKTVMVRTTTNLEAEGGDTHNDDDIFDGLDNDDGSGNFGDADRHFCNYVELLYVKADRHFCINVNLLY